MGSTFDYAGPTAIAVRRISEEPIVEADSVPGYGPISNAGLIHHDGRFHLFARGVRASYRRNDGPGDLFLDYISDVLVFTSSDGRWYEFQQVLAAGSPNDVHSYEDPRVQRVSSGGAERVVMSYTNLPAPESGLPWRVGVHRLAYEGGRFCLDPGSGRVVGPGGIKDKDGVVFNLRDGRVGLIHRIHPTMQLALFDSLDELWDPAPEYWDEHLRGLEQQTLIRPSEGAISVGAGAPPVATENGLLRFFHEREGDHTYTTEVALLDDETGRVQSLLPDPIMRPELAWERTGDVDNIIFVQGAVSRPDGTIYLTYGAADRSWARRAWLHPRLRRRCTITTCSLAPAERGNDRSDQEARGLKHARPAGRGEHHHLDGDGDRRSVRPSSPLPRTGSRSRRRTGRRAPTPGACLRARLLA